MRQQTLAMAANVHDKHPLPGLLHGAERRVYGDSACASQKVLIEGRGPNAKDFSNQRTRSSGIVDEAVKVKNRQQVAYPIARGACARRGQATVGLWPGLATTA